MSVPNFQRDNHSIHSLRGAKAYKNRLRESRKRKDSFGSQEIDVKDYIISPEGWEGIMLSFYFITIPYITGILFLFLAIARGDMEKFLVFDITAFFIVWAIGYEIVATLLLIAIFISYIKFMSKEKKVESNRIVRQQY